MAIRINRVYTRTGDAGETGLAGGGRVPKDSQRIEAFGTVDELNTALGVAAEELRSLPPEAKPLVVEVGEPLGRIQQKLFDVGAYLATVPGRFQKGMPTVGMGDVEELEKDMDRWEEELAPLESFILPGGGRLAALLHVARAVCRRAEREALRLHRLEALSEPVLPYLNRLSDWLFVACRIAAKRLGRPEVLWKRTPPPPVA